jgi:hypothetical protein
MSCTIGDSGTPRDALCPSALTPQQGQVQGSVTVENRPHVQKIFLTGNGVTRKFANSDLTYRTLYNSALSLV